MFRDRTQNQAVPFMPDDVFLPTDPGTVPSHQSALLRSTMNSPSSALIKEGFQTALIAWVKPLRTMKSNQYRCNRSGNPPHSPLTSARDHSLPQRECGPPLRVPIRTCAQLFLAYPLLFQLLRVCCCDFIRHVTSHSFMVKFSATRYKLPAHPNQSSHQTVRPFQAYSSWPTRRQNFTQLQTPPSVPPRNRPNLFEKYMIFNIL